MPKRSFYTLPIGFCPTNKNCTFSNGHLILQWVTTAVKIEIKVDSRKRGGILHTVVCKSQEKDDNFKTSLLLQSIETQEQ